MAKCVEIEVWLCQLDVRNNYVISGSNSHGLKLSLEIWQSRKKESRMAFDYFFPLEFLV